MILSEEGVKSYFFKKLIPLLNGKINEVLNKFDLPLQITFNELMEEEIKNYTNGNYVVNYYSLSEGEKKRIDIAILLAFINITKIINNWNCNLILMDELLDSSVDGDGLDKMIECLRNYISDSHNLVCIYLISHRPLDSQFFDGIYTVRKNHGFSEIEIKTT
jgi:DNA repair exonuclease SbcCD ATPase subunit